MTLRVMTYNILNGGIGREQLIAEVLLSVQPDLVILEEVYSRNTLEVLAKALNASYFFAEGNRARRVGLLSRRPILKRQSHHPFPFIWRNFIEVKIESSSGKPLHIFGVHPLANLGLPFEIWRYWEARYVTASANTDTTEPCLITGDFNAIAPGDKIVAATMPDWLRFMIWIQGKRVYHFSMSAYFQAGFTDCFRHLHPNDPGFTLPPPNPNARLDYVLVNDALKPYLRKCWVVGEPEAVLKASDHYPVVAEFEL